MEQVFVLLSRSSYGDSTILIFYYLQSVPDRSGDSYVSVIIMFLKKMDGSVDWLLYFNIDN